MRATLLAFLVVTPVVVFLSCSDKKDSGGGGGGGAKEEPVTAGSLAVVTGTIQPAEGADPSTVAGALVQAEGHPEISAITDESGNFGIENVLPGTIALYVGSNDGGAAALKLEEGKGIGPTAYGLKIPDVVLKSGAVTDLGEQALKKTGGFSGKVVFYSNPNKLDLTGSEVFVPGTGFIVKTDATGAFSLGGLPPGKYSIRAQHTGFAVLDVKDIEVLEGQTSDIGNLALSISTGPEGGISVVEDLTAAIGDNKAAKIVKTKNVKLKLNYDSDAALMKVADEPSFTNKEWVPVTSSVDWPPFKTDGLKSLYVMYSDLNGLESSPYKDEVYIDTTAPQISSFMILNDWVMTAKQDVFIDIVGADAGSGIAEIMMSETSDEFDHDEKWLPFNNRVPFEFKTSTSGNRRIHARVRDFAGRISNVLYDDITKGTTTKISDLEYTSPITLYKAQSPYSLMTPNITFRNTVTIEAGVIINVDSHETISFKGALLANGTEATPVLLRLTTGAMCEPDTKIKFHEGIPGASSKTIANHLKFLDLNVEFNGGTFNQPQFFNVDCTTDNRKRGEDRLTINQPVFDQWGHGMIVMDGLEATTINGGGGTISQQILAQDPEMDGGHPAKTKIVGGTYTLTNGMSGLPMISNSGNDTGDLTVEGVTIHGQSSLDAFTNSTSATMLIKNSHVDTCRFAFMNQSNGKLKAEGGSADCYYGADNPGTVDPLVPALNPDVHITGMTLEFNEAVHASETGASETIRFTDNNITVSDAVAGLESISSKVSITGNNIECINNSGPCDILRVKYKPDGTAAHTFTLTGNNIDCPLADPDVNGNGCRGFYFSYNSFHATDTMTMTMSLNNNYWSSRVLNTSFALEAGSDGVAAGFGADVRAYRDANWGTNTLTGLPTSVTNAVSTNNGAGL